ncbi:LOW QUALITY PROTEIN: hypothetical protein QC761_602410 [Podospora bellae-mahoneyi]|uniref:Nephrocystin 3-like N-terminal domain-containing protein n=1 Tax=Podospora bellae-mahoneyi TaxID=2093777 RepID=A0ABR0F906_9PEZI|nr:LOW QUALITY PROTEIN: hypothetical protein QC761_602410 [Podospora bellae-mahoneyi]
MGTGKAKKYHTASDTATDESCDDDDDQGRESGDITTDPETSEGEEAQDRKTLDVVSKTSLEQDADQADEYGDWLFESREYPEWVKYPQSLLWLYGNYSSSIIRNLEKTFGNDPMKALASWYFRLDHEDTKRMHLLLASLLGLTMKCKKVPDDGLYETLHDYQGQGQLPDDSMDLFNHLQRFISKADRDIFLVLDGFDHVLDRRGSRKNDIKRLDIILKLIQKEYTNLHVLVVSKYEKDIAQDFENKIRDMLVSVDVEQGFGKVLETFVERKLEDTPVLKGEDFLKGEVKQRLGHYQSSQGSNFHWARSILKQVVSRASRGHSGVEELPENIAARYQDALEKVAANSVKRLKDILVWLMNQKRPLSQAKLAAVVKLRNAKEVAGICPRVLVETATENEVDVFRFTHFSVQEYLKDPFSRAPKGQETIRSGNIERLLPPQKHDAHLLITKRCLEILLAFRPTKTNNKKGDAIENTSSSDSDSDRLGSSTSGPNRRRVTIDARDHGSDAWRTQDTSPDDSAPDRRAPIKTASRKSIDIHSNEGQFNAIGSDKGFPARLKELENEICSKLLLDKEKMRAWLDTYDPDGRGNKKPPSAVYYAVKLELNGILTQLVEEISKLHTNLPARRRALDQRDLEGTVLQLAAVRGESDIINLLLQQGADVNVKKGPHGLRCMQLQPRVTLKW